MSYCSSTGDWIYIVIIIYGVISALIFMPLSIWTLYKYHKEHEYKTKKEVSSPKCLYRTSIAFYITCIIYMICFLFIHIFRCIPSSSWWTIVNIGVLAYIVHWALLIATYLARLYYVFRDTAYEVTQKQIWYFVTFSVILIISIVLIQVFRNVYYKYNLNLFAWIVSLLLIAMLNIVLCGIFVMKLNKINSNVDETETAETVGLMRKYTVLTIMSSSSTLVFIIYLCFMMVLPRTSTVQNIGDILNSLDVSMDILCTTLTFAFAKSGYYKVCACCDLGLARLCGHKDNDETELNSQIELQMPKAVESASSVASTANAPL